MKDRNICKFNPLPAETTLTTHCFIFESCKDVMLQKRRLRYTRLFLVAKGAGAFHFDGLSVPFAAGTLAFGFRDETFYAEPEEASEYMYIDFDGLRADDLVKRFDVRKQNRVFSGFDGLTPLWKESLLRAGDSTVDLAAESMLLYAFSRLSGATGEKSEIVDRITELSENGFTDAALSLASVSAYLGYNAKYLSHLFKKKTGIAYSEYLRTLRLRYAVSLFEQGLDSVKNVAFLSGFSDPLYFSTVFKKSIGIAPTEYLRRKNEETQEET